jgi:hypothetical protein
VRCLFRRLAAGRFCSVTLVLAVALGVSNRQGAAAEVSDLVQPGLAEFYSCSVLTTWMIGRRANAMTGCAANARES